MKTLLLTLCLAFATAVHAAESPTDAEINRAAAAELAKTRALRTAEAQNRMRAEAEEKRVRESGITARLEIFQIMPREGYLAKPLKAVTGPERVVETPRSEIVQGTGLDAHKQVERRWIERTVERAPARVPSLIYVRADPAGLIDGAQVEVVMWPTGPHHYGTAGNFGKTVAGYTVTPPKSVARSD